ncbi:IS3 family transposase [Rhodospirillales bacterium]|nr:IS3 family transposase [Rhodospirillales bacterium]
MGIRRIEEFCNKAARIALTSGLSQKKVADDLGIGLSTLSKRVAARKQDGLMIGSHDDKDLELVRLSKENRILREERDILKKSNGLPREPKPMRFRFIEKKEANFWICKMCKVLGVSDSGYYAWVSRPASQRQRDDMVYLAHIRAEHERNYCAYGRKRITDELRDRGVVIGERRVGRLMQDNDICIIRTHKFKRTTNNNYTHNIAPNLLDGDFQATGPNQKWAGDISYLWTAEGWLYLAVIIDLFSRRVIGWAISNRLKRDLPIGALKRAIALRQPLPGVIHHSDRGSQYCFNDYRKLLKEHDVLSLMSGKGNCYDNAAVETFFKTLKAELTRKEKNETREQAQNALFHYINLFYNPRRRNSYLGSISPVKYESLASQVRR